MGNGIPASDAKLPFALTLRPPGPTPLRFKTEEIDTKLSIGYTVLAADINGDKKLDVLVIDPLWLVPEIAIELPFMVKLGALALVDPCDGVESVGSTYPGHAGITVTLAELCTVFARSRQVIV